jgi:Glycosyltransferase
VSDLSGVSGSLNILHVSTFLQGGAGRVITDLMLQQQRLGHRVVAAVNARCYEGYCSYEHYFSELEQQGIKVAQLDSLFKRDLNLNFSAAVQLAKIIDQAEVDIIHSHAAIPSLVCLMAIAIIQRKKVKRRIPIVQTMHGWGGNKTAEQARLDLQIMNSLDSVVSVSAAAAQPLVDLGFDINRISVIENGISEQPVTPVERDVPVLKAIAAARQRGDFVVATIGSLCERKNQNLLLQACANLNSRDKEQVYGNSMPSIFYVAVGEVDSDYGRAFSKKLAALKLETNVYIAGCIPQAEAYLSHIDLLVSPSRAEGMPIALLEAFKNKTLCLCSDIPQHRSIVGDNLLGLLFKDNECGDLEMALARATVLTSNEKENILASAEDEFRRRFTLGRTCDDYLSLYSKVMEG